MHTVFALLCFVVVIHWLISPYPSGLLHWHCGNLTIAPVPAKQPWWLWINTSCEFIMNDCITTTKQSTTKPCAYLLGYTVINQYWLLNPYIFPADTSRDRIILSNEVHDVICTWWINLHYDMHFITITWALNRLKTPTKWLLVNHVFHANNTKLSKLRKTVPSWRTNSTVTDRTSYAESAMLCPWWRHQMKTFQRYWPFVRGSHRSPVDSRHKGQWSGALMFSLICALTNGWANSRDAGDLSRHRTHYDVILFHSVYVW